jgi:hypothetical protein
MLLLLDTSLWHFCRTGCLPGWAATQASLPLRKSAAYATLACIHIVLLIAGVVICGCLIVNMVVET